MTWQTPQYGPPRYHPPAPQPAMVIDIGATSSRQIVVGSIVAAALGLIAIVAGIAGAVEGGTGVRIAVIVVGSVFLLIGLLPVIFAKKAFRARRLVLEPAGIRWDDPNGKPWAVRWQELAAVAISRHGKLEIGPESMSDKISGAVTDKVVGENVLVRLDLFPADHGFHGRHPQMAHLWELQGLKSGYRLPLGRNPRFVPQIDAAMRHFRPQVYRGVQETRGFMGLA